MVYHVRMKMLQYCTHSIVCDTYHNAETLYRVHKKSHLLWSVKAFLMFGAETFWKHDMKENLSEIQKTINSLTLLKEFEWEMQTNKHM